MNSPSTFPRHWRSPLLCGVLSAFVFVLIAFGSRNIVLAQCTPNPCPTGWLCATTPVLIPNTCGPTPPNLTVTVTYCYPDPSGPVGPKTQIDIKKLHVEPACFLTAIDMDVLKLNLLEQVATSIVPCNQMVSCTQWCDEHPSCFCPDAYAEWTISATACMKFTSDGSTGFFYNPCGVGTCISVYQVCCRSGDADATWLATQADNGNCLGQQDCVPLCQSGGAGITCCDDEGNALQPCPTSGTCPDPVTGCCPEPDGCPGARRNESDESNGTSPDTPSLSGTDDTLPSGPNTLQRK